MYKRQKLLSTPISATIVSAVWLQHPLEPGVEMEAATKHHFTIFFLLWRKCTGMVPEREAVSVVWYRDRQKQYWN